MTAIRSFYELVDEQEIEAFLNGNAAPRRVMAEAVSAIPEYFPDAVRSTVRYRPIPESAGRPYVLVRINAGIEGDERRKQRDRFVENWWLAKIPEVHGKLTFDVEYT